MGSTGDRTFVTARRLGVPNCTCQEPNVVPRWGGEFSDHPNGAPAGIASFRLIFEFVSGIYSSYH